MCGGGAICLSGCGRGDGVHRAVVEGTVTYQGEPIAKGIIVFAPVAGVTGNAVQLIIKDGKFSSSQDAVDSRGIAIGKNDVQITGFRKTGKQIQAPDNSMEEEEVQYIPKKYNENSELQKEIKTGKNEFEFNLD